MKKWLDMFSSQVKLTGMYVSLHIFKGKKATQATVAAANVDLQGCEL